MSKRMLIVFNMSLIKTLLHQITTARKRRKVAGDIYIDAADEAADPPYDVQSYLAKLFTYLLALAIAGVTAVSGASAPDENTMGADTTKFVQVPMDILMSYYHRAARCTASQPPGARLRWLQRTDQDERGVWVTQFRNSDKTLGQVIKETMASRDAHWHQVAVTMDAAQATGHKGKGAAGGKAAWTPKVGAFAKGTKKGGGKGKGKARGQTMQIGRLKCKMTLKNGAKLCKDKGGVGRVCGEAHAAFEHA